MNRDQKAAVVEEVAAQIQDSTAVLAIDYRGLSVTQAVDLRVRLGEADATFRVVKNRLTWRAADKAGAESLKELLEGPTAFAFVRGDAALAAKALATFRRDHQLLAFKGGTMDGETVSVEQLEEIARLPGREQLQAQFVGVLASPVTGLVRGLGSLLGGLALQLGQIRDERLVGDGEAAPAAAEAAAPETTEEAEPPGDQSAGEETETADEAGAEGAAASADQTEASEGAANEEDN